MLYGTAMRHLAKAALSLVILISAFRIRTPFATVPDMTPAEFKTKWTRLWCMV